MKSNLPGPTELALRNRAALAGDRILVIDPPDSASVRALRDALAPGKVRFLIRNYPVLRSLGSEIPEAELEFTVEPTAQGEPPDRILLFLPKGKELLAMTAAQAAALAAPETRLLVVGANRGGIRSAPAGMERSWGLPLKIDAARHCALLESRKPDPAARTFRLEEWESRWEMEWRSHRLRLVSLPGVFSHGRLDDGTARLLPHLPDRGWDRALDVGCGCGILAAALATARPEAEIELVDSHVLAVEAASRTMAANGRPQTRVLASDLLSELEGPYDLIVSNPPFHTGLQTEHGITRRLVEQAATHLGTRGALWLVVNRFLPVPALLEERFARVTTPHLDGRYRVLRAERPRRARGRRA